MEVYAGFIKYFLFSMEYLTSLLPEDDYFGVQTLVCQVEVSVTDELKEGTLTIPPSRRVIVKSHIKHGCQEFT